MNFLSSPVPGGEGEPRLGGKLRREEYRLSRTGVRVDRDGAVDVICEGAFRLPPPFAPARPEWHMSIGKVAPPPTHADLPT
jgi:hypothetical protein